MFTPEWPSEDNCQLATDTAGEDMEGETNSTSYHDSQIANDEIQSNKDSELESSFKTSEDDSQNLHAPSQNGNFYNKKPAVEEQEHTDDGLDQLPIHIFGSLKSEENSNSSEEIEITHDAFTRGTTVTKEGHFSSSKTNETNDDSGGWTATFPDTLETKTSNPEEHFAQGTNEEPMDEQDWQMKNFNENDSSHTEEDEEVHSSTDVTTDNNLSTFSGGDIWTTDAFAFEGSPLKDLLDSQNYSLVDLLAQDELLQELRGCLPVLVEYFGKPEVVAGLVECLVCDVPKSKHEWIKKEEERRKKAKEMRKSSLTSPTRCAPTVEVNSPDTENNDGSVEAYWNSPKKDTSPGDWIFNRHQDDEEQPKEEEERTPEEEYDLKFVRYPYMACEVICSEVGATIDVLVDGYVDDIMINDDDDSLLGDNDPKRCFKEESFKGDDAYNEIDLYLDDDNIPGQQNDGSLPTEERGNCGTEKQSDQQRTPQRRILDLLFSVLIDTPPASLDDRRAGYFEKVLVVLFRKRSQAMSDYMNTPLIITSNSAGMAKKMSAKTDSAAKIGFADAISHLAIDKTSTIRTSSYVSLSQQFNAEDLSSRLLTPSESLSDSPPHTPTTQFVNPLESQQRPIPSPSLEAKILSPNSPPMLMCALFDHLHSHSMMHIVQRLLLPSPAREQQNSKEEEKSGNSALDKSTIGSDDDNLTNVMNNEFMNAINQMNDIDEKEDSDDEDLENEMNHLFRCNWSESPAHALELLLARLEGRTEPFLLQYGFPVGYDASQRDNRVTTNSGDIDESREEDKQEAILSCSQHASEILITIIQSSSLDSAVMISLSTDPALDRILKIASLQGTQSETNGTPVFVPYESTMTCAMTVVESLALQLGGYGSVDNTVAGNDRNDKSETTLQTPLSPEPISDPNAPVYLIELGPHTPPTVSSLSCRAAPTIATPNTLVKHLPTFLAELSDLLSHPVTKTWKIPAQYTHNEPRPLLGTSRLRILRVLESLVLLGNPSIDAVLIGSDCLEQCMNLFWEFEWCSMLHQSAANLLVHLFESKENRAELQNYFLVRCRLLERLMEAFDVSPKVSSDSTSSSATTDIDATNKLKKLLGVGEPPKADGNEELGEYGESPNYGGAVLAMKSLYRSEQLTSSLESERGSESSNEERDVDEDEAGAIVHVSDDDVDSAMDAILEISNETGKSIPATETGEMGEDRPQEASLLNNSTSVPSKEVQVSHAGSQVAPFRRGYMGHVMIICQALVNVCNNQSSDDQPGEGYDTKNLKDTGTSIDPSPSFEFESSPALSSSEDELNTKKLKKQSPLCQAGEGVNRLEPSLTEDILFCPTSPILKAPSSPTVTNDNALSQSNAGLEKPLQAASIIRQDPIYAKWQNFVSTVFASEMSVQAKPLGGEHATSDSNVNEGRFSGIIEDNSDNDFLGVTTDNGVFTGFEDGMIVGELDMDENDLDIAASMMEALRLPPSHDDSSEFDTCEASSSPPLGHNRKRGVIGGGALIGVSDQNPFSLQETSSSTKGSGIANFGSVIQRPTVKDYVYDDPLGGVNPFGSDDSSDEEENETDGVKTPNEDVFMSDAMVISNGTGESSSRKDNMNRSASIDSTDEDESSPPVMDLFAGNFSFEEKNESTPSLPSNDDSTWANFANFESEFEPTPIGPPSDSNETDAVSHYPDDYFAPLRLSEPEAISGDPFAIPKTVFDLVDTLQDELEHDRILHSTNENGATVQSSAKTMSNDNISATDGSFNRYT
ncbi:hypothetical protein ACHAXS_009352 [Conticribra weissflogii]